jgi:hypothetical protein
LAKLSNDGQKLIYASYFGGLGDDSINSIALDARGNLVVTGTTDSRNLPRESPLQANYGGGDRDVFVAKFDPSLRKLLFSTYLGGVAVEENATLALDLADFIYVAGDTFSTNFPVTPGAFQTNHIVVTNIRTGQMDGFVTKLQPDGSAYVYSTYFMPGTAAYGIAVDMNGSAYITGESHVGFSNDEIRRGFQPHGGGKGDAFLAKLKPNGANVDWFSYLGGSGAESAFAIALDDKGDVYVCGITDSSDFPVRNGFQLKFHGGPRDGFIAKVTGDGNNLIYSSYLGGGNEEWAYDLAVANNGTVIIAGQTYSRNFPTLDAFQTDYAGSFGSIEYDAFVSMISPTVPPPRLNISLAGTSAVVTWASSSAGFTLEECAPGDGPASWRGISTRPVVIGGQNTVIVPRTFRGRFYRLVSL